MTAITDIIPASPMQNYLASQREKFAETDEKVLRAYELQEAIKAAQKELDKLMGEIGAYGGDKNFVVTDLKPHRIFQAENLKYIRENMPEVWKAAKPSQKYVWAQLCEIYGEDALLAIVRENNPEEYENHKNLTFGEFDSITGDSSKKKKHAGKAYTIEHRQSGKSHIEYIGRPLMMSAPSRYAELDDGDDWEDDE